MERRKREKKLEVREGGRSQSRRNGGRDRQMETSAATG